MHRRHFLSIAGAALAASQRRVAAQPQPDDWQGVRDQFNLDRGSLHFAGFLLASHPRIVREAIARHRDGLDANPAQYVHSHMDYDNQSRAAAAQYLHSHADEIALTDSTSMGLGLLYNGLRFKPGEEVLTSMHEHYSTQRVLQSRAACSPITVRSMALYENIHQVTEEALVAAVVREVRPHTRAVALTWVHSSTGLKMPIARIAAALRGSGCLVCVDGVHALGVEPIDVKALGCDFFVAGCHKWLCGPRGTGLVWGKPEHWDEVRPLFASFDRQSWMAWLAGEVSAAPAAVQATPGGFHSFEHRWALEAAFVFHTALGPERVSRRIHALGRQMKQGITSLPKLRLITPMSDALSAGIVCFEHQHLSPTAVVEALWQRKIVASTTPYLPSYARLAPSLLNDEAEVEQVLAALAVL